MFSQTLFAQEPASRTLDATSLSPGTHKIEQDTTFTHRVTFATGAVLDIAEGVTVTFADQFTAGDQTIFTGKGVVRGVSRLYPEWFGAVGDGVADDTQALQRALDSFPDLGFGHTSQKHNHVLVLRKRYRVKSLTCNSVYLNIHAENAWLIAEKEGSYPHLIRFNRHFCSITGRLSIEGSYNIGYETMIHVNTRHFVGNDIVIWRASLGWLFGDRNWATSGKPGDSELGDSEVVIKGGATVHCLRGVEAIGSNTIIVFADSLIYSFPWSLSEGHPQREAWLNADFTLIRSIGALIYFQGGKLANFNRQVPLIEVQPIRNTQRHYYSNYGGVGIFNAHIEAGIFFSAINPHQIATQDFQGNPVTQKFASLQLISCTGYVTDAINQRIPIETDPMFTGTLIIQNCNFYGDHAETFARISNPKVTVKVDEISVRNKWNPGLSAIEGGTIFFANRLIFDVRSSRQTVSSQVSSLVFRDPILTADTKRFQTCYDATTGEFTVPAGGLDHVQVRVGVHYAHADRQEISDLIILKNGREASVGQIRGRAGTLDYTFPKLEAGDVIAVRAATERQSRALADDEMTYLQITASKF